MVVRLLVVVVAAVAPVVAAVEAVVAVVEAAHVAIAALGDLGVADRFLGLVTGFVVVLKAVPADLLIAIIDGCEGRVALVSAVACDVVAVEARLADLPSATIGDEGVEDGSAAVVTPVEEVS